MTSVSTGYLTDCHPTNNHVMEPSLKFNIVKKWAMALTNNHIFDLGFTLYSDPEEHMIVNLCPCCEASTVWRIANGVFLEDDEKCEEPSTKFYSNQQLVLHLEKHSGWRHSFIKVYLYELYKVQWWLPYYNNWLPHYHLETSKNK